MMRPMVYIVIMSPNGTTSEWWVEAGSDEIVNVLNSLPDADNVIKPNPIK